LEKWYCLFVESGREESICRYLSKYFITTGCEKILFPRKKVIEKKEKRIFYSIKPLFPGYILLNLDLDFNIYYKMKNIPKVYELLKDNDYYFKKIKGDEIKGILCLINSSGLIDISKMTIEESKIYVINGPLKGKEELIKKVNKHTKRAKVQACIGGKDRIINLGIEFA
jgi:transcriptional antiterminator NusG